MFFFLLQCDDVDLTQKIVDMKLHSLLFLNIPRYVKSVKTLPSSEGKKLSWIKYSQPANWQTGETNWHLFIKSPVQLFMTIIWKRLVFSNRNTLHSWQYWGHQLTFVSSWPQYSWLYACWMTGNSEVSLKLKSAGRQLAVLYPTGLSFASHMVWKRFLFRDKHFHLTSELQLWYIHVITICILCICVILKLLVTWWVFFCNRYASGTVPWGNPNAAGFEPQKHDDGYLEVIGFTYSSLVSIGHYYMIYK